MKKYISVLALVLFVGFLVFNISSNRPSAIPRSQSASIIIIPPVIAPPSVTTDSANVLSASSVNLSGTMTATGGDTVTTAGFDYGLDTNYGTTVSDTVAFTTPSSFNHTVDSLSCGTTYHFRAFAIHPSVPGRGNGVDLSFTTNGCHSSRGVIAPSGGGGGSSVAPAFTPSAPPIVPPVTSPITACNQGDKFSTTTGLPCTSFEVPPTPNYPITGTLIYGSTGEEVKTLQLGLNNAGFNSGPVDGIFGPITKGAVIRFQIAHGLAGDGIFGIKSRAVWDSR